MRTCYKMRHGALTVLLFLLVFSVLLFCLRSLHAFHDTVLVRSNPIHSRRVPLPGCIFHTFVWWLHASSQRVLFIYSLQSTHTLFFTTSLQRAFMLCVYRVVYLHGIYEQGKYPTCLPRRNELSHIQTCFSLYIYIRVGILWPTSRIPPPKVLKRP